MASQSPNDLLMDRRRLGEAELENHFIRSIRISPEDFNEKGMVRGELVLGWMHEHELTLSQIGEALDRQGLQFSLSGFIDACKHSGRYGSWSTKKMLKKALFDLYPELMKSEGGKHILKRMKIEVKKAYERSTS